VVNVNQDKKLEILQKNRRETLSEHLSVLANKVIGIDELAHIINQFGPDWKNYEGDKIVIRDQNFLGQDIRNFNILPFRFKSCNFEDAIVDTWQFNYLMNHPKKSNVKIEKVNKEHVDFTKLNLEGIDISNWDFSGVKLTLYNLEDMLEFIKDKRVSLVGAIIEGIDYETPIVDKKTGIQGSARLDIKAAAEDNLKHFLENKILGKEELDNSNESENIDIKITVESVGIEKSSRVEKYSHEHLSQPKQGI
jgi:hypothetical protein